MSWTDSFIELLQFWSLYVSFLRIKSYILEAHNYKVQGSKCLVY